MVIERIYKFFLCHMPPGSRAARSRRSARLLYQVVSPLKECFYHFCIVARVGFHADTLRAEPIEIVGDISTVHGPLQQPKNLWNVTFVFVPSLRDASYSDGIPPIVKHFIDPTEKLFVLWRKIHRIIRVQLLTRSAMGGNGDQEVASRSTFVQRLLSPLYRLQGFFLRSTSINAGPTISFSTPWATGRMQASHD